MIRRPYPCARRGAAAVEFAAILPVILLLIMGAIDCGRSMMCLDLMANASRAGCRAGTLPQASNSDVQAAVNALLNTSSISGAAVTVTVGGQEADVSTAKKGDQIQVTVSVNSDSTTWLPSSWFFGGKTLSKATAMRHE